MFKDLSVGESRASAEIDVGGRCATVFLRKLVPNLRTTVNKKHPTRLSIYLKCHSLPSTSFHQVCVGFVLSSQGIWDGELELGRFADL